MKTIIACTDFSPNSTNAVQYAAAFAAAAKSRLVLFHYVNYPIPATDLQGVFPSTLADEASKELEQKLQAIKTALTNTYHIEVEYVVRYFDLALDMESVFHEEQAALVVLGMQGHSALVNTLFGNVTSDAIRRGKLPILVVPKGSVFHNIRKILLASDDHEISNPDTLKTLLELADDFDAYIEVLTLFDLEKTPTLAPKGTNSNAKRNLETLLEGTRHGYSYENEVAVDRGILYEAARSGADMVAMIPHHHSFLSNLLTQSETQRIAASISLPLLVLGEKVKLAV